MTLEKLGMTLEELETAAIEDTWSFAAVADVSSARRAFEARFVNLRFDLGHVLLAVSLTFAMPVIFNDLVSTGDADSSGLTVQVPIIQTRSLSPFKMANILPFTSSI